MLRPDGAVDRSYGRAPTEEAMAERPMDPGQDRAPSRGWIAWFAWAWVVLVALAAAAEMLDLERLRQALDLTHSF